MHRLGPLSADRHVAGAFLALAAAFVALEYVHDRFARHDAAYDARETLASAGVAIGNLLTKAATSAVAAVPFLAVYQHRLLDIPLDAAWSWFLLFVGVEFFYYWFHVASHRIRWFWATHAVHHSATRFNLSAAVRLGWTGQLSGGFVFFLPLAGLGFHPLAITLMLGLGLLYQFFLHTALPIDLGPLEWVLNTPAHHRVHHASNESCLDKNYGSVLILFDRLFGSFAEAPCDEPMRFGVKGRAPSNNPLRIALGEWLYLIADTWNASGASRKLRTLFGPP
jgi:sterol desaturase/sphingolipid hydroxylase (fatty acid hydroxylase superfamily)